MTARKPIEPGCDFSVTCELPGHVTSKRRGRSIVWSHFKPTTGQRKTRREQWRAERATAAHHHMAE